MHPSWSHLLNILTSFLWSLRVQTIANTCRLVKLSGRITRAGRGKGGWSQGARHFNLHFRDPESTLSVSPGKRELRNHARQKENVFYLGGNRTNDPPDLLPGKRLRQRQRVEGNQGRESYPEIRLI